MVSGKKRVRAAIEHQTPDQLPLDFGATPVSGIHIQIVERLREHYGLEKKPIKVWEPYQMLGTIDEDLSDAMGIDTLPLSPEKNMFGIRQKDWKAWKTHWGQEVLVPGDFNVKLDDKGDTYIYPEGDLNAPPSGRMPVASFFFDAIVRQEPIDEMNLNVEDNLEEFNDWTESDIAYWKAQAARVKDSDKAVVANFGGSALGDIALVPAMQLKNPKGIRDMQEWYMSTLMRQDYVSEIFERQSDLAVKNLATAYDTVGDAVDVVFICGTDFGTQDSTFCAPETFRDLWLAHYQKINNWIHENTSWKTFKHSCGAVESFMELFIEAGFDIINPVQINAAGMDPNVLKEKYGDRLTFWGGGVDTQKMLPFGTPAEVREQVLHQCEVLAKGGGFVFNTVHNVQANTPMENLVALFDAIHEFKQ